MTIQAFGRREFKLVLLSLVIDSWSHVACRTGNGPMSPLERITGLIMLRHYKLGRSKSFDRMALLARAFLFPTCKLFLVKIAVAVSTGGEFKSTHWFSCRMAFVACHGQMAPFEPIAGAIMVKFCIPQNFPSLCIVATLADVPQFTFMDIIMTIKALVMTDILIFRKFFIITAPIVCNHRVAFYTWYLFVFSNQNILRFSVIKL